MKRDVRILITGGTIDKVHDPRNETLAFSPDGSSKVPDLLEISRCDFPATQQIMQIDSLQMTTEHRNQIVSAIKTAPEPAIIITHGTSTMGETARFLQQEKLDKVIVLTGAMRPFSLGYSDGPFNLGGAIIASQTLNTGVYGVMNGRIFPAEALHKNNDLGRFDI